ncbi:MAG: hypothetical protein ABW137_17325 [Mycobacterium sp.]
MARNVRLGIIRARHDTSLPVIPDDVCRSAIMLDDRSLFSYWSDTTYGQLDFIDSVMFPWVDIALGADTSRTTQATLAVNALRAKFPNPEPLDDLDGLVVYTYPGTVTMANPLAGQPGQPATISVGIDGGATGVAGLGVAVLPVMSSDHTFMCHEAGHVLGFEHTFGLDNNGTDWDPNDATIIAGPEYGSPYDLMSSGTFAGRWLGTGPFYSASPTFSGTPVPGWPNAGAYGSMGPHMSRAGLYHHMPDTLAHRIIEDVYPIMGATVTARLQPASAPTGAVLLVLHHPTEPPNGVNDVYVEYRTAAGWDRGLDPLGPSLSREGVVVHSLVDQPNVGLRVWYRGCIPTVSLDSDVSVAGTNLVVRADAIGPRGEWVDVSVTVGTSRAVEIRRGYYAEDIMGAVGAVEESTTPCGDAVRRGEWATATTSEFLVRATGFGGPGEPTVPAPLAAWTVGGVPISGNGSLEVPVGDVTFPVEYSTDPANFALTLSSRGGERYETPVTVTVTGDGTSASATAAFNAQGWFTGINPDDIGLLGRCLAKLAERYQVTPGPFRIPTPEPQWSTPLARLQNLQLWLAKTNRLIDELPPTIDQTGRAALRQLVELQSPPDHVSMLDTLLQSNVDFSVAESDIRDWLDNPEFTPYPALSEALLAALGGRRLVQPVFLDVIAFNYENAPAVASPRRVDDVMFDVLRRAVVEGFNVRYDQAVTDFGELLVG